MARRGRSLHDKLIFPHLTSQDRRRLRRRSERQAHRYFQPEIMAARAKLRSVKQQKRTELRSVAGASNALQKVLSAAIGDIKGSGLSGSSRKMLANEFASRKVDAAQSVPLLQADVRSQYAPDIASAREGILGAKVDRSQKAAELFASSLSSARTQSRRAFETRRSERQAKKDDTSSSKTHVRELKVAIRVARNLLATGALNPDNPEKGVPWSSSAIKHYGSHDAAWRKFEELLAAQSDVDHRLAFDAVRILRRRLGYQNHRTGR